MMMLMLLLLLLLLMMMMHSFLSIVPCDLEEKESKHLAMNDRKANQKLRRDAFIAFLNLEQNALLQILR